MHPEFRRWSRQTAVELDEERLAARWVAVEQIRAAWSKSHARDVPRALEMVRVTLGLPVRDHDSVAALLAPLDGSGKLENQVAAAMVVLSILEDQNNGIVGPTAAYALGCAAFAPTCQFPVTQLLIIARTRLSEEAVRLRRRAPLAPMSLSPQPTVPVPNQIGFNNQQFQVNPGGWQNVPLPAHDSLKSWIESASQALQVMQGSLLDASQRLLGYASDIQAAQRLPEERIDLLTWVNSGYSLSRMQPVDGLSPIERILPAARELADLTQIIPGPYAAPALLHQFLGSPEPTKTVVLTEALRVQPPEWRRPLVTGIPAEDLCPVLRLMRAMEQADGSTLLPPDLQALAEYPVHPTRLALELYEELLLGRLLQGGKQ